IVPYTSYYLKPIDPPRVAEPEEKSDEAGAETLLDVVVQRLIGRGQPAHAVWLPPLAEPPTLDQLLPPLAADPPCGLSPAGWARRRGGQAVPPAAGPDVGRPVRGRRPRGGGRRHAERQVDPGPRPDRLDGAHPHPGGGAVLLPGLRRRHAVLAARPAARRLGGR